MPRRARIRRRARRNPEENDPVAVDGENAVARSREQGLGKMVERHDVHSMAEAIIRINPEGCARAKQRANWRRNPKALAFRKPLRSKLVSCACRVGGGENDLTAGRNPIENPAVRFRLAVWIGAARPRTLSMALAPVFVGGCFAWPSGGVNGLALAVAALSAACIQVATNLFNDAGDFERGGDGPDRLGPPRAAASGLLTPVEIKRAACGFFASLRSAGSISSQSAAGRSCALGALSLASGWAYASGPAPISYSPLGELFVIAFFGLGAVGGTFWLCAGALAPEPLLAGLALGLFAAGVLMVNNFRDADADARVGRRTLAIVAGPRAARALFAAMMAAPFLLLGAMIALAPQRALWLAFGAAPLAWAQAKRLDAGPPGPRLNAVLARTAQTQALYAFLLGLGALA